MSIPPPPPERPDQPTEPLGAPVRPAPRVTEREVVVDQVAEPAFDPRYALAQLEDGLRSLRTAVVLLGIISLAALGVGLYALLRADEADRSDRTGASRAGVSQLEDRVDDLERDLNRRTQGAAESGDVNAVEEALTDKADAEDVADLRDAVTELREQREQPAEADPQTTQAITELSRRLDELEQQVQDQQQAP